MSTPPTKGELLYNPARHNRDCCVFDIMKGTKQNADKIKKAIDEEIAKGGIIRHEDGRLEKTPNCGPLPKLME